MDSNAAQAAHWEAIRRIYAHVMPAILAESRHALRGYIFPNFFPWVFTPIEKRAWESIRRCGIPLYPQVPVDRYFIDFANPYYQIGLELDGAAFHDREVDTRRDRRLIEQGWKIFRVCGAETGPGHPAISEREDMDEELDERYEKTADRLHHWIAHTCDGVITALDLVYFSPYPRDWPPYTLALASLREHQLVPSPLPYEPQSRYVPYKEECEEDEDYYEDC